MLHVNAILGDAGEPRFARRRVERLLVGVADAPKRRLRAVTDAGTDIGVDLPRGSYLRHGAVLADDGKRIIVVERAPEEAAVVILDRQLPPEQLVAQAVRLGHAFGNQHLPIEVDAGEVRVPVTTTRALVAATIGSLGLEGAELRFETIRLGSARPLHAPGHSH